MMNFQLTILLRFLAATVGAYLSAIATSFAFVQLLMHLDMPLLGDAVYFSLMLSYLVFFLLFIACFAMASIKRIYWLQISIIATSGLIEFLGVV